MAEYIKRDDALRQVLLVETRENMFQSIEWEEEPDWKYCPVCGSYNGGDDDV